MVENAKVAEVDFSTMPEDKLKLAMQKAVADSDWGVVTKIAKAITRVEADKDKLAKAELQGKLAELTLKVKTNIGKAIQKMYDTGELDGADGVWFSWDFGSTLSECRLTKRTARASGSAGTGGGRKYDVTTNDLLKAHGAEVEEKSGKTYQELYEDAEASDDKKNAVYRVRVKLLKVAGAIS